MRYAWLAMVLTLPSSMVLAANVCTSTYCDGQLAEIYIHPVLQVQIKPKADMTPLQCTPSSGGFMRLKADHPFFSEIYSTLLTSVASGKRIRVRVDTDDPATSENEGQDCVVVYTIIFSDD